MEKSYKGVYQSLSPLTHRQSEMSQIAKFVMVEGIENPVLVGVFTKPNCSTPMRNVVIHSASTNHACVA